MISHKAPDEKFMRQAVSLSRRALGLTAENPPVACLIVREGRIISRGVTARGGRPHAETEALAAAGKAAKGATAYVTLEPCSHHGQTGPCAQALIEAGVRRVVVAVTDPDPRVSGQGLALLSEAGIDVQSGCLSEEAGDVLEGFLCRIMRRRPFVALKIATSLDGHIALANGSSRWITGKAARAHGHLLRARFDAILVGAGTVRADNPSLTCRLPGLEDRSPQPVVLDRRLETPIGSALMTGRVKPVLVTGRDRDTSDHTMAGARVVALEEPYDLSAALAKLGELGVNRMLVEGGARVAAAFVRAGYVDRVYHYRAGKVLGGDAHAAIGPLGLSNLEDASIFTPECERPLGADHLTVYSAQSVE